MSQADDLLNSLSETVEEHTHTVTDSDTYFIIDPITRKIENTAREKNTLMQYDHDSEVFTFELARYVEGHDMTLCNVVKVHWNNIDGTTGQENADVTDLYDLRINPDNPDTVICSWKISRQATQLAGILSFLVQYLCESDDGTVTYEWHSDIYSDIEIKPGRNNGAAVIEYTDILEQWRARLFGTGESVLSDISALSEEQQEAIKNESEKQQAEIEAKGAQTLETIPEDYTEVANMAEEALRRKADAIVMSDNGASIFVDDASDSYLLGLKVYGKTTQITTNGYQLFDASRLSTLSSGGATFTNNGDGSFTVSGSGNMTAELSLSYQLTHSEFVSMFKAGTIKLVSTRTRPYFSANVKLKSTGDTLLALTHAATEKTITQDMLDNDDTIFTFDVYGETGEEIIAGTLKPMLYQDGDGTWEPYSGGKASPSPDYLQELESIENPVVSIYGKNLVPSTFATESGKVRNGITFTYDDEGCITLNGAATASTWFPISYEIPLVKGKTYTLHGLDQSYSSTYMYIKAGGINYFDYGNGVTFEPTVTELASLHISLGNGVTFDNVTIKPQVELGDEITEFEQYTSQTITLSRTLPGLPVNSGGNYTDSNGQQWICDEIDFERGVYIQRIRTFAHDGSLGCVVGTHSNGTPYSSLTFDNILQNSPVLSNQYLPSVWTNVSGYVYIINKSLAIVDDRFTDYDTTYAILQEEKPIIQFALAEPIETELTLAEIQAFKALHTNRTNTTFLNNYNAMMDVKYVADIEKWCYKNVSNKVQKFDIILPVDKWVLSDDGMYYTQVVDIAVRETSKIDLHPTPQQLIDLITDGISMFVANQNGIVTAYSVGDIPGTDITIQATETVVVYV